MIMEHLFRICLIVAFFGPAMKEDPSAIRNWGELESDLQKTNFRSYSLTEFRSNPRFIEMSKTSTDELCYEMMAQESYPTVLLAGFHIIAKRHGRETGLVEVLPAFLRVSGVGLIPWGVIYQEISESDESTSAAILNRMMQISPPSKSNVTVVVNCLNYSHLYKWFHATQFTSCPTVQCYILERLFLEAEKNHSNISSKMREMQHRFAMIPGSPRLVFITTALADDPLLKSAIKFVLEDAELDDGDLAVVVSNRKEIVETMLRNADLSLSPETLARVTKMIKRVHPTTLPNK